MQNLKEILQTPILSAVLFGLSAREFMLASAQETSGSLTGAARVGVPHDSEAALNQIRLNEALKRIRLGNVLPSDLYFVVEAGRSEAISDLKKIFESTTGDEAIKYQIASALIRLGDKGSVWWDFLVQGAADALNSDAPSPFGYDASGKPMTEPSPDYVAWAKANKLTLEQADNMVVLNSTRLLALGQTRDRRAIPLLRQALSSSYFINRSFAIEALAQLQDAESIPFIVSALRRSRPKEASAMSFYLKEFKDPQAQAATKEFKAPEVPK